MPPIRRTDRLDFHLSVAEKNTVRVLAAKRGISLSSFVRQCIGAALKMEQERDNLLRTTYPDG